MKRTALLLGLAFAVSFAAGAQTAPPGLPAPSFSLPDGPGILAAAGARLVVETSPETPGCLIHIANPARATKPTAIKASLPCLDSQAGWDASIQQIWLGRTAVALTVLSSTSPHGDDLTFWIGPLPGGPLRQVGAWSWTDNSEPWGEGCAWEVAAGGGVIAAAKVPNRLPVAVKFRKKPLCPAGATTRITLTGAAIAQTVVNGSWTVLATDGKRLALARLDAEALPTGEVMLFGLDGTPLETLEVDAAAVKASYSGWLTPDGLVLREPKRVIGPGWTIERVVDATVALGRVLYVTGRELRVRRVRDGVDRLLVKLPKDTTRVAAGSFGLAVAITDASFRTNVYRIPWLVIDRTLRA